MCGHIKCAHRNGSPVLFNRIPKERRTTCGTKATSHILGVKPCEIFFSVYCESYTWNVYGRFEMRKAAECIWNSIFFSMFSKILIASLVESGFFERCAM